MDPTGMSSPLGQLLIAAGLIAAIVVGIVALRRRR
jgi:subtilase family serine protease